MKTLYEIEERYEKELESLEEWAYLRSYYRHALALSHEKSMDKYSKLKILKDVFFGFFSWFNNYEYMVFSDTNERKKVNGKWFDKSIDYIIEVLGKDKTLLIEEPNPTFYNKKDMFTKHVSSRRLLDSVAILLEKCMFTRKTYLVLDEINKEYNIQVDYVLQIKRFNARYFLHRWMFKWYKTKLVIVNCYYSRQYVIKSAQDLNIETIEVQHGVITKDNDAYNSPLILDNSYFPNYLLSFGESEVLELKDKGLINKAVFPVGSFYLDYLKSAFKIDDKLWSMKQNYNKVIGVSLQKGSEKMMIDYIISVAHLSSDIMYIIIPRYFNEKIYDQYEFPVNVVLYPDLDCYQIIMHCDFHCTFYSACTVEVPSLGIQNILVDFNGRSRELYHATENKTTTFVKSKEEFLDAVYNNSLKNSNVAINNHFYIKYGYRENIQILRDKGIFHVE